MNEPSSRMTQPGSPPSDAEVTRWIGTEAHEYWQQITQLIDRRYPDVFTPEWLFGGRKHGWSLRYKKSRSFCTLIPEKNRFALLIVFGAEERTRVEAVRDNLSQRTINAYDAATTYHDGKWLLLAIGSEQVIEDVSKLLEIKRRPKRRNDA